MYNYERELWADDDDELTPKEQNRLVGEQLRHDMLFEARHTSNAQRIHCIH